MRNGTPFPPAVRCVDEAIVGRAFPRDPRIGGSEHSDPVVLTASERDGPALSSVSGDGDRARAPIPAGPRPDRADGDAMLGVPEGDVRRNEMRRHGWRGRGRAHRWEWLRGALPAGGLEFEPLHDDKPLDDAMWRDVSDGPLAGFGCIA